MTYVIVFSIAVCFCFLTAFFSYRYSKRTFNSIDKILDCVLNKNTELPFEPTADSRISKLTHKAMKIIQRNAMDFSQTKQEKETIQSFLSDMSYQMKTPLSGVSMYTDLLLEGNITESEQQDHIIFILLKSGYIEVS